jgi:hypothetical protein
LNRRDAIRNLAATSALGALPFETLVELGREVRAAPFTAFQTLDSHQSATLREAAEMILPQTDTPGATDAQVAEFVDLMMTEWMDPAERDAMTGALAELDRRTQGEHGTTFVESTANQRLALMTALDAEVAVLLRADGAEPADDYVENPDGRAYPTAPEHPFYQLKRWTLIGYFTSEPGMTEALKWNPFPGRWEPCMTIGEPS